MTFKNAFDLITKIFIVGCFKIGRTRSEEITWGLRVKERAEVTAVSPTTLKLGTLESQSFRFICVWFCSLDWTYPLVLLLVSPRVSYAAAVVWFDWSKEVQDGSARTAASLRESMGQRGAAWGLFLNVVSHFSVVYHSHFSNKTHIDCLISLVALIFISFLWGKATLYYFIFNVTSFLGKYNDLS